MLANIFWTNEAHFSGADDNRFDEVFGTLQNQAILVVDAAVNAWQRVIDHFNYGNGSDTYNVTISMNPTAMTSLGTGVGANATVNGYAGIKPNSATIGIGWRSGITPGTNTAAGWFLDPTPNENSEFSGISTTTQTNEFVGLPLTNLGGADLYTGVLHELGHAMGLSSNSIINALATNTTTTDTINTPASSPAATYWRFDSANVHNLWTSWDSGGAGGGANNAGGAQHFAPQGAQVTTAGRTYFGATGLMNASFTSRSLIDDNLAYMLQDAYGYTVIPQSSFGTFYDRLDIDGSLHISTPTGSNDQVELQVIGGNLRVDMTIGSPVPGIDQKTISTNFLLSNVTSIDINTGDGADTVNLHPISSTIPITLTMGNELDSGDELRISGGAASYDSLVVDNPKITSTGLNIVQFLGVETLTFYTNDGNADIYMPHTGAIKAASIVGYVAGEYIGLYTLDRATPTSINGNGGNDIITIGDGDYPGGRILSPVTVRGGDGDDTINVAKNLPFSPVVIQSPITVFGEGDSDTLVLGSGTLDAINGLVTFDGGGAQGATGNRVFLNDTSLYVPYDYNIAPTSLTQNFLFGGLNYSNTNRIVLNASQGPNNIRIASGISPALEVYGNDGYDNFIVGNGNLGLATVDYSNLFGGDGIDTLVVDDSAYAGATSWIVDPTGVFRETLGIQSFSYPGFEKLSLLTGAGGSVGNSIDVQGTLHVDLNITGGAGADNITLTNASNYQDFTGQSGPPEFHQAMTIDGGSGFNTLTVDDTTDFDRSYSIWPDHVLINEGAPLGLDFSYDSFQSVTIEAPTNPSQFTPYFHIFGTSSDIPSDNQMTILGSSVTDQFVIHPHDAAGNLTINGNLGILGGNGIDTLTIDDSGSLAPIAYRFENHFGSGTTNIDGLGAAGFGAASDIENIVVNAGDGDDQFDINSYQAASALTINAKGGTDKLSVSPIAKNVTADVMGMSSFTYNGGNGFDYFLLYNDNSPHPWLYTRTATYLLTQDTSLARSVTWNQQDVEYLDVTGGSQPDIFLIQSTPTVQSYNAFRGAGGNDNYVVGNSGRTNLITANVAIVNDGGDDFATIDDSGDAVGRTAHVDEYFVGGTVGDDLFGPGGYVYHVNLRGTMTLQMGGGADTVYVVPNSLTPITIHGNNPSSAPGDSLGLAFGHVTNPVFTPLLFGQSQYTFDNPAKPIVYDTFETVSIDSTNPLVVSQSYTEAGPVPAINAQFSERVFNTPTPLQPYYLQLINLSTSQPIPFTNVAMTYNLATNVATFTFPGYAGGRLPAGMYSATFGGSGPTDFYGNGMPVQTSFSFTATAPKLGDYNNDGGVSQADYTVWKANFGETVAPFTAGDGNGDGVVDSADYTVWRDHLGQTYPGSGSGSSLVRVESGPGMLRATSGLPTAFAAAATPQSVGLLASFGVISPQAIVAHVGLPVLTRDSAIAAARRDDALLAWLASRIDRQHGNHDGVAAFEEINDRADGLPEPHHDAFDTALKTVLTGDVRILAGLNSKA